MGYKFATNINLFILLIIRDKIVLKKDLVDPITAHKGLLFVSIKKVIWDQLLALEL